VEPKITELDTIAAKIEELLGVVQLAIDTAIDENLEADKYLRLGQDNFSNAQAAFGDRRFDDAREGVNLAMEALDRSLEYRENADVRRLRDETYPAFFTQINLRENERVIAEVRNLIRRGIQHYRDSEFEDAQAVLVQAQSRWRDVNPTDNEEVADWLTLVRKAINLKKGWEIQETEAPYEQITQLLRLTSSDYNQAVAYLDLGNERDAERSFQNALSKLDQIQINFPKLKEANNLRLQIKRILEPEEYRMEFEQELSRAEAVLSRGVQAEIQETYSALKDYELMEAENSRLENLIFNYEIALGLRLPPPSASEIAESRDKYALAADIFNKKQRDLYDTAIDLLNDALKLWPDNRNAEDLKDDILRNLGQTIQTLSSDDMRRLEEAERLFGDRDYTGSYRIVVELLKNPNNQNNDRIIELKGKLETRLGIGETEG
jgi:hypothetical protein